MMNVAYRLLLTVTATSLLLIIFVVQKGYTLGYFFDKCAYLATLSSAISYILYLLIPISLSGMSIFLCRYLGKDEFKSGQVVEVEHANNSFLPSYLGYFFVALSIGSWENLFFVYGVLFVFTFLSQALYFNPLFLLFGFEFYNIKTKNGATIFLITQECYKTPGDIVIDKAYRINNYTFIERG